MCMFDDVLTFSERFGSLVRTPSCQTGTFDRIEIDGRRSVHGVEDETHVRLDHVCGVFVVLEILRRKFGTICDEGVIENIFHSIALLRIDVQQSLHKVFGALRDALPSAASRVDRLANAIQYRIRRIVWTSRERCVPNE